MIPPKPNRFFSELRTGLLGPTLSPDEVSGVNAILAAAKDWPLSWTAYALATAYHETAHSMLPIKEFGGDAYFCRMYDPKGLRPEVARRLGNNQPGDGVRYCGRGYVQLTGRANYAEFGLEANPEQALNPAKAAEILETGMRDGLFGGRKLEDFLPASGPATLSQFISARRVINGTDRRELVADYAWRFQVALLAGGCT